MLADRRVVEDQHTQRLGIHRGAVLLDHILGSVEEQLECRQSLLPVDDVTNGDETRRDGLLVQHDGAQEMRRDRPLAGAKHSTNSPSPT